MSFVAQNDFKARKKAWKFEIFYLKSLFTNRDAVSLNKREEGKEGQRRIGSLNVRYYL
jgi:hypothetical protein